MNFQNIIVAIIILAACFYIGRMLWRKTKSFSSKSPCGTDCGCDNQRQEKIAKI